MQCACGSHWFLEEKLVRPAGLPSKIQHTQMPNQELARYRFRCSECGLIYGQEKPAETQPSVAEAEIQQPPLKKRGRPATKKQREGTQ